MQEAKRRETPDGNKWVVCGCCGHKLMRITHESKVAQCEVEFEIKCSSCKKINVIEIDILC